VIFFHVSGSVAVGISADDDSDADRDGDSYRVAKAVEASQSLEASLLRTYAAINVATPEYLSTSTYLRSSIEATRLKIHRKEQKKLGRPFVAAQVSS
jgi:hypothetical protein